MHRLHVDVALNAEAHNQRTEQHKYICIKSIKCKAQRLPKNSHSNETTGVWLE